MSNKVLNHFRFWQSEYFQTRRSAYGYALLVMAGLLFLGWQCDSWVKTYLKEKNQQQVAVQVNSYGTSLTQAVNSRLSLASGLSAFVNAELSSHTRVGEEEYSIFAAGLYNSVNGIRNIALAPNGVMQFVYPYEENKSVMGYDPAKDSRPNVRAEVQRAIRTRQIVLSLPCELIQGGQGVVARQAIFLDDAYWGLANVVIDVPPLLEDAGITSQGGLDLALKDQSGQVFFGSGEVFSADPVAHTILLPDGTWELAGIPTDGWEASYQRMLWGYRFLILVIVGALTEMTYLFSKRQERLAFLVKQRTRELGESEAKYRELVDNALVGIYITQNHILQFCNQGLAKIFGYQTPDELIGIHIQELVAPESWARVGEEIRLRESGQKQASHYEFKAVRADGTVMDVEVLGTAIDYQGRPAVQGVLIDITDRKRAKENLQRSEESYRSIFHNATDAIYIQDKEGRFLNVNQGAIEMYGYPREFFIGKTPEILAAPGKNDLKQISQYIENAFKDQPQEFEFWGQRANGEVFPKIVRLNQGTYFGQDVVIAFALDITEQVQAEADLRRRLAELEVLYENSLAISTSREPREIAQRVIEVLAQKLDWHHAAIRSYDPQTDTFELLAFHQPGLKTARQREVTAQRFQKMVAQSGQGLSGWVVQQGRSFRSGDVTHNPHHAKTYPGLRSGLYAPIKSGERVLGVIGIESTAPDAFSETDERLLSTVAGQLASALENARLFTTEKRRAARLSDILKLSTELSTFQEEDALLEHLVKQIAMLTKSTACTVMLLDERANEVILAAQSGLPQDTLGLRVPLELPILQQALKASDPLVVPDIDRDAPELRQVLVRPDTQAFFAYPMKLEGHLLGILTLSSLKPEQPSEAKTTAFSLLAERAAAALWNVRLQGAIQKQANELQALYEIALSTSRLLDRDLLIARIHEHVAELLRPDAFLIALYHPGTEEIEVVEAVEAGEPVTAFLGRRLLLSEAGLTGWVAHKRQPLLVRDTERDPLPVKPKHVTSPARSWLGVPLTVGKRLLGVISVQAFQPGVFDENHLRFLQALAAQVAIALENARLYEQTRRNLKRLEALHTIDTTISSSMDLNLTMNVILDQALAQLAMDAADILLFDPVLYTLECAARKGFETAALEYTHLRLGQSLAGRAALERRTISILNLQDSKDAFLDSPHLAREGFIVYYGVPLISKGELEGVLELFRRTPFSPGDEWLRFLDTLTGQAAIAIDNTTLFTRLQRSNIELALAYDITLEGWAHALEIRDMKTEGHSRRVTKMTVQLAQVFGMSEEELVHLRRGALLHDIGKIGIPDSILRKPGPLTEEEWVVMRQHPRTSYELLARIDYLKPALDIPYCHHEKWDGTGYPRCLKGEQIPLAARLFAIVDVYDALTSDRPYRQAWTKEKALAHIRDQSGKHFDPKVVEAFLKIAGSEGQREGMEDGSNYSITP